METSFISTCIDFEKFKDLQPPSTSSWRQLPLPSSLWIHGLDVFDVSEKPTSVDDSHHWRQRTLAASSAWTLKPANDTRAADFDRLHASFERSEQSVLRSPRVICIKLKTWRRRALMSKVVLSQGYDRKRFSDVYVTLLTRILFGRGTAFPDVVGKELPVSVTTKWRQP